MSTNTHQIRILSSARRLKAGHGQNLLEALVLSGIQLRADCGGKGVCGKCLVQIQPESGSELTISKCGASVTSRSDLIERLACQTQVYGNLAIEIPASSVALAELIAKPIFFSRVSLAGPEELTSNVPEDCGIAVDLGTTTIAVFLCDLDRGKVIASGSARNPQFIFGYDVMSRISVASAKRSNLKSLQRMAVAAINQTVASLAAHVGIHTDKVKRVLVVGNPTMIHLFLGIDPSPIGVYPYRPNFYHDRTMTAAQIGLQLHANTQLHTLPFISGFLGSDIIASAMASDLDAGENGTMLIDVGTSGEIMLSVGGNLIATSCATGPAFEGAAVRHGVYAVSGAVDTISIEPVNANVNYTLIQPNPAEREKATGICGAGVVSATAKLLRAGILSKSGAFNLDCGHPNLRRNSDGIIEFLLVPKAHTRTHADITFTQKDIRAVQLAKAAIYAGILLLCREVKIELPQRIVIAGAFGSFLDKRDAKTIGMLPPLSDGLLKSAGNAAGEGAVLALLNGDFAHRAQEIAHRTRVVDLASHPDFQEIFLNSLTFPDVL